MQRAGCMQLLTYGYYRRNKRSVREEVARACEATALSLNRAAVLVQEVWIEQDGELRLRYEKGREKAPNMRQHLRREDILADEHVLA
jgi:hypothetical protein